MDCRRKLKLVLSSFPLALKPGRKYRVLKGFSAFSQPSQQGRNTFRDTLLIRLSDL